MKLQFLLQRINTFIWKKKKVFKEFNSHFKSCLPTVLHYQYCSLHSIELIPWIGEHWMPRLDDQNQMQHQVFYQNCLQTGIRQNKISSPVQKWAESIKEQRQDMKILNHTYIQRLHDKIPQEKIKLMFPSFYQNTERGPIQTLHMVCSKDGLCDPKDKRIINFTNKIPHCHTLSTTVHCTKSQTFHSLKSSQSKSFSFFCSTVIKNMAFNPTTKMF